MEFIMYKIKTSKSASKRFKRIASGSFKRKKSNLRHLLTKKKTSYKRKIRSKVLISHYNLKSVLLLIPYS